MTPLNAKPLKARPKGVRLTDGDHAGERRQLLLELNGMTCALLEDGREWTELNGWQEFWATAEEAQRSMNYAIRDIHGAYIHRATDKLYLRTIQTGRAR